MKSNTKIIFLVVSSNSQKVGCICQHIQLHFNQGQSVLIVAPSVQAVEYLDDLLWKNPPDSFLPHLVSQDPIQEKVVITSLHENLNQASVLMNLCPQISPIAHQFDIVYELYDETQPEKLEQSKHRQKLYVEMGYATILQ